MAPTTASGPTQNKRLASKKASLTGDEVPRAASTRRWLESPSAASRSSIPRRPELAARLVLLRVDRLEDQAHVAAEADPFADPADEAVRAVVDQRHVAGPGAPGATLEPVELAAGLPAEQLGQLAPRGHRGDEHRVVELRDQPLEGPLRRHAAGSLGVG
jgi:hypothetical protein